MTDLKALCEQSFYEEVYHYEDPGRSIVLDRVSGRVFMKKVLSVYDEDVFRYLEAHPDIHIPRIHSFWREGRSLVVIEELVSGYTLSWLLDNDPPAEADRMDILRQVCDGLIFLHSADPPIIHRDIKPSNLMITDEGVVKLIDYDAAKVFDAAEEADTMLIGTRGSAAPEQYGFGKCDTRTDIYALGILIRLLFPEDPRMLKIADKAASLSPEDRYQDVRQIRRLLGPKTGAGRMREGSKDASPRRRFLPPGFRTGTPWKMLLASVCYFLILYFSLTIEISADDGTPLQGVQLWINRLCILCVGLSLTDLFTGWTGIFRKTPFLRSRRLLPRIPGYILLSIAIVLFWALVCVILTGIFT